MSHKQSLIFKMLFIIVEEMHCIFTLSADTFLGVLQGDETVNCETNWSAHHVQCNFLLITRKGSRWKMG